jgi:cytochrome c oxidase assembly protein subunit 11
MVKILFYAKNNSDHVMTVQAIPSIIPSIAIAHFHKIQCFCFEQQTLKAGESRNMPVVFKVDNTLPRNIHTITLAYTLFGVK